MTASESPPAGRVVLASGDGIATLTLHRPDKLNAIGPDMLAELDRLMAEIDVDPDVRVVIVTGSGDRAFSVGADVNAWTALEPLDMWRRWIREGHRVLQRLEQLRQPTIAAINGYAFGGGLELALAADIRIAADSATFALPETKIGTLPGWAGTTRLPRVIGVARSKQIDLLGMPYRRRHCRALGVGQRGRRTWHAHGAVPRAGVRDRGECSDFSAACQGRDQW